MSIKVNSLVKNYHLQKAVNNISFTVNKGEIVGFLGPNGAGKSTTMKIITGYLQADGGSVEVCGEKVSTESLQTKKKIGYLPESNALYLDMYVREYLRFISNVHDIQADVIENIITIVGLTLEANKKIGQLSKGYKQRVGLAAALIHDPEVLILDEPTSGLDPNQIVEIREVIKKLGQNKTVLFSSHILQEVEAICDRVIIINKGNIIADDTLQNLQRANAGAQSITVQFKENIQTAMETELSMIGSFERVNNNTFKIQHSSPDIIKKHILEFSLKNNLNIVSLQSNTNSLEEVFKKLTSI